MIVQCTKFAFVPSVRDFLISFSAPLSKIHPLNFKYFLYFYRQPSPPLSSIAITFYCLSLLPT